MTQQPKVKRLANRKYQSNDVPALHTWLESQGYVFYGKHADNEYGRFSHQESHAHARERSYSNRYIQVLTNGEIYTPDPHSWRLLDSLVDDTLREREV